MAQRRGEEQPPPAWLLKLLGEEIQARREAAGFTQQRLGEFTHCSRKAIGAYEQGVLLPPPEVVELAERALGNVGSIRRIYQRVTPIGYPDWFKMAAALERIAEEIRHFEAQLMPGLLQTEAYARAVLSTRQPPTPDEVLDEQVALRVARSDIFKAGHAPHVSFVLDEAVFRRWPKDPTVRVPQLEHVLKVSALPNVALQVIPFDAGHYSSMDGLLTYMSFAEAEDCAYVEPPGGGQVITNLTVLANLRRTYDLLRAEALSPAATEEFITHLLERM